MKRRAMNGALGWFLGGSLALIVVRDGGIKEGISEEDVPVKPDDPSVPTAATRES